MSRNEWEDSLAPFAIVLCGISESIKAMNDDEILRLRSACERPSKSNCWLWTLKAAELIKEQIAEEIIKRGFVNYV